MKAALEVAAGGAELLGAAAPAVLNHLWEATLFAAAVGLLAAALRGAPAALRCRLYLLAALKFLVPSAALAALAGAFGLRVGDLAAVPPQAVSLLRAESWTASLLAGLGRAGAVELGLAAAFLWAAGAAWRTAGVLVQRRRIARAVALAEPVPSGHPLVRAAAAAARRLRLRRDVPLCWTAQLSTPAVWGAFAPVLLLPRGIGEHLTDEELEAVLLHELEHVRRRDNLAGLLLTALRGLFWFHPLVWWLERRLLAERERACDDRVVALCGEPRHYARGLVKVVRFGLARPAVGLSGATTADLRRRIEQIVSGRPPRLAPLAGAAVAAAVVLLLAASVAASAPAGERLHRACRLLRVEAPARFVPPAPGSCLAAAGGDVVRGTAVPPPVPKGVCDRVAHDLG